MWLTSRPGRFTPRISHQHPLKRKVGRPPQSRPGRFGKKKKLLSLPGFEPWTKPATSHYNDHSTPAPNLCCKYCGNHNEFHMTHFRCKVLPVAAFVWGANYLKLSVIYTCNYQHKIQFPCKLSHELSQNRCSRTLIQMICALIRGWHPQCYHHLYVTTLIACVYRFSNINAVCTIPFHKCISTHTMKDHFILHFETFIVKFWVLTTMTVNRLGRDAISLV